MSNIPTASTSTASTSSASTSLALPSTSTSQLLSYTFRQEVECTTTDDSEMSSDDELLIFEEHSSTSNSNPIEPNNSNQFIHSVQSSDDASWSSIESSDVSLSCGDEKSGSDDNIFVINDLIVKDDQMNISNNGTLENPSELASHTAWTESIPTNEDSNETKCPNGDEQKIPMLLFLEPSENENQIDEIASYMINLEEHDGRLLELEKESEYINVTAWMYRPLDPTIQ